MDEELHGGAHLALDLLRRRPDRVAGERAMMKRAAHQGEKLPRREDRIDELELPLLHLFGEIGGERLLQRPALLGEEDVAQLGRMRSLGADRAPPADDRGLEHPFEVAPADGEQPLLGVAGDALHRQRLHHRLGVITQDRLEEAALGAEEGVERGAAIYMELHNRGDAPVAVVGARVESAASAAVHGHRHADGMMRMYPVPRLEIAAGASVRLEPGGYHLMVGGLAAAPRAGAVLPFCLRLEDGAEQCAEARVRAIGE